MLDEQKIKSQLDNKINDIRDATHETNEPGANTSHLHTNLQEIKNSYADLINSALVGIFFLDLKGHFIFLNKKSEEITGYTESEIVRKNLFEMDLLDSTGKTAAEKMIRANIAGESAGPVQFIINANGGKKKVLEIQSSLISVNGKQMIQGLSRDITEQMRTQEKLIESEELGRAILDATPDIVFQIKSDGTFIGYKASADQLFLPPEDFLGKKLHDILPPDLADLTLSHVKSVNETKNLEIFEYNLAIGDEVRHFEARMVSSNEQTVISIVRDITEAKRAENLQRAVYRISQAVDSVSNIEDLYKVVHEIIQEVMPADNFYFAFYDELEDILSFPYFVDEVDVPTPPGKPGMGLTEYVLRTGKSLLCPESMQMELRHRGEIVLLGVPAPIWLGIPLKIEEKVIGVMAVQHYSDINAYNELDKQVLEFVSSEVAKAIDKKRSQQALLESEEKYKTIIDNSLEGIHITQETTLRFCNNKFAEMFGYDSPGDIIGRNIKDLVAPESWSEVEDQIVQRETGERHFSHYEFTAIRADGSKFEVESLGSRIQLKGKPAVQGVLRDISEQRQLEEQLRQAQKMEAVGRLAGGVAHDFNNLLTAITGNTELALMFLDQRGDLETVENKLRVILDTATRATNLTRQLLAYSRKQPLQPKVLNVNEVITDMDKMLRRIIGEDIELRTIPGEKLWNVKVDKGQTEQIIVNLVVNARDSMPDGGKITIECKNVVLDRRYARSHPEARHGPYVMLAVSDTGCGMTEEVKAQIFEPFYTTKETGKGTGLGLATVYGIVKQSEGYIWVYSEPDKGTAFKLYFPRAEGDTENLETSPEYLDAPKGSENILVVEDEEVVKDVIVETLEGLGYNISNAIDGQKALDVCRGMDKPIDLLITDVVMPNLNGVELAKHVRQMWPDVKVLFMSAYTENDIAHRGVTDPKTSYLQKPLHLNAFASKVRDMLDSE